MAEGPRRRLWALRILVFLLLVGLVFVLGSINVPFLQPDEPSEVILLYIFSTLVFLAFVIYGLVLTRYLARLYVERRRRVLGTKFKTKMVAGALALSLLPAVALFFLSYALLNRTLDKWFPRPLEIVRQDAEFILEQMFRAHEERTRELAAFLADHPDLRQPLDREDAGSLQQALTQLANRHGSQWAAVLDRADRPLAVYQQPGVTADYLDRLPALLEPRSALAHSWLEPAGSGRVSLARVRVEDGGRVLGTVVVAQPVPRALLDRVAEIERQSAAYETLRQQRKSYRWQALLILLLLTVLILLAATWSALHLSRQVTVPIQALAQATQEVSQGNFQHRVDVPARDELGVLVESFNQMTAQLGESRRRLEEAVTELDQRRQWIETILESIPTGVITLGPDLTLLNANEGAREWLGAGPLEGVSLLEHLSRGAAAACSELIADASRTGFASRQMDFGHHNRVAHVVVSVSALRRGPGNEGYVLVVEDITDLLKAEKLAAWKEVAQRMAHEIKNPLTPIRLSADRIRRYVEQEGTVLEPDRARYRELIGQCARLIGEEVDGLKTLVDEFSHFARFPASRPELTQLNEVVRSTVALYGDSASGVELHCELGDDLPPIQADPALLRRALANLIDNATEAVAGSSRRQVQVRTDHDPAGGRVVLSVSDTGRGIPPENKERLFLPFFSTKPSGMGLGLAIVSRIVAEHRGTIRVEDNTPSGTRFVVEFPVERPVAVS